MFTKESPIKKSGFAAVKILCVALMSVLLLLRSQWASARAPTAPTGPLDAPTLRISESNASIALGGGFIYWEADCNGNADPLPVYIRRLADNGDVIQTLYQVMTPTIAQCESVSRYSAADDDGFFYVNYDQNRLDARLSSAPATVVPLVEALDILHLILTTDEDYVYFNKSTGIYRSTKDSLGAVRISDATNVTGLAVDDTDIYWLDSTGLWRSPKTCTTSACWNNKEQMTSSGGSSQDLTLTEEGEFLWVNHTGDYWRVMRRYPSGGASSLYTVLDTATLNIASPVYHDNCYFWLENTASDLNPPHYNLLRRYCGQGADTIAEDLDARGKLAVGEQGIVFGTPTGIYQVDFDAAAITKDFYLEEMEVTQGIQNLNNSVDLVAGKTTYVRVYGGVAADNRAEAVQVSLSGWQNSIELPGSPLYPVHAARTLVPGEDWDRAKADSGWLFQIPTSWLEEGTLTLLAEIDPLNSYDDPDTTNNAIVKHIPLEGKAPLCLVFMPVRSEAGKGSENNPTFRPMVDLATRLMPVSDVNLYFQREPVEELQVCWKWGFIPYPCFGPYELWESGVFIDDATAALTSIALRSKISDLPCSPHGRTQFVGMVHEDSRTDGVLGISFDDTLASWVKLTSPSNLPSATQPWNWPGAGSVVVHEMGHNIGRKHVDCGGPPKLDNNYPYTDANGKECILDDGGVTLNDTYFGFDVNALLPIRPNTPGISDLMSYSNITWVSDYTWQAFFNKLPGDHSLAQQANNLSMSPAIGRVNLTAANDVVVVSGIVVPSTHEGRLNYAWTYPAGSINGPVLQQLQTIAAPTVPAAATLATLEYGLILKDANNATIATHIFTPTIVADNDNSVEQAGFLLSFPAPDVPVARIVLIVLNTTADSLQPGAAVPDVSIRQPAGGETFTDHMTIVWQATDADIDDRLLFTIQYSPDLGQTWNTLAADWPGRPGSDVVTLTLDSPLGLPRSSTGGLVRVLASDGYNTAIATSPAFVVSNQPPRPYIVSPGTDQAFEPGEMIILRGGADDVEDGSLDGAALTWTVTGQSPVTGTDVLLNGLAPGDYTVALTAEDSNGLAATEQVTLTVSPLGVPDIPYSVDEPALDGRCDDEAYTGGAVVGLRPYPGGNQGTVHIVRDDDALWACFSGLNRGDESMMQVFMNSAGILVDANDSSESSVQTGDRWIYVQENGTPAVLNGPSWGSGSPATNGVQTRVSANDNAWNAELRIDAGLLGGWSHVAGLELLHVWVPATGGGHYSWPYAANSIHPDSWATTALGEWPRIDELIPNETVEDSGNQVAGIYGDNFENGAVVLWNGAPKTPTLLSKTFLMFPIDADDVAAEGTAEVRVRNPGLEASPSNALTFLIKNPVPEITSLTPDQITAGVNGTFIGASGSHFDDGAVVLWDGKPATTTVTGSTYLMFMVETSELTTAREVGVVVSNPEPGGGPSNVVTFTVVAPPNHAPGAPTTPNPANGATNVPTDQTLTWQCSDPDGQPLYYDIAFGATNPPPAVASDITVAGYSPEGLETSATYYWRITASDSVSATTGPVWSFTTAAGAAPNRAPKVPDKPNPSDGLSDVPLDQILRWQGGDPDGDPATYTVSLGTGPTPPVVATNLTANSYDPPTLNAGVKYYWNVVATDGMSTTTGPTWAFITSPSNHAPYAAYDPSPSDEETYVALNPLLSWKSDDPDGDSLTYSVGMGTSLPVAVVATGLTHNSYTPPTLTAGTRYYWSIRTSDGMSTTTGPMWSFTTIPANRPPDAPYKPTPLDHATGVALDQAIKWRASDPDRDRLSYTVSLGTTNPPPVAATGLAAAGYTPTQQLVTSARYYWSITVSDGEQTTAGPVWSFMTAAPNRAPNSPYAPDPADLAIDIPVNQVLNWRSYDPDRDSLTYALYFGDSNPPPLVSEGLTTTTYHPGTLAPETQYYWAITASDGISVTTGATWSFQTAGGIAVYLPLVLRGQ